MPPSFEDVEREFCRLLLFAAKPHGADLRSIFDLKRSRGSPKTGNWTLRMWRNAFHVDPV